MTAQPSDAQPAERRRPRILIVEDEALIALEMEATLEEHGYAVIGVKATGAAALAAMAAAAAAATLPELVLMDIRLKGEIDGIEAARRIGALYPDVRIAFLTGQADPTTRRRAEATRPAAYLLKPLASDQLLRALETILHRN